MWKKILQSYTISKNIRMKILVSCLFLVVEICILDARPEESTYTSKFDNIDLEEILSSDRLLNNYFKCIMDEGRCPPEGAELKRVLPEAIENECAKCTEKQREGTKKVITYIVDNKPEMWQKLMNKYDPDGKYRVKYEKIATEQGIQL